MALPVWVHSLPTWGSWAKSHGRGRKTPKTFPLDGKAALGTKKMGKEDEGSSHTSAWQFAHFIMIYKFCLFKLLCMSWTGRDYCGDGEYTKIKGYWELLHHHIYNSQVLHKHLENQTYKNKNMTHPSAFPPVICSPFSNPQTSFNPIFRSRFTWQDTLLIFLATTVSEEEWVPPKTSNTMVFGELQGICSELVSDGVILREQTIWQ